MSTKRNNGRDEEELELLFLEKIRERCPAYVPLLIPLGDLYTRMGHYAEGLDVDERLAELRPYDSTVHYNLACSYSLTDQLNDGIASLKQAIDLGYSDLEHLREDRDLDNLRALPEFSQLVRRLEEWDR